MSDRRAVKPLDPEAVKAANAAIAAETGGRALTMGPEDAELRKKWMDAYVAAGGKVEPAKSAGRAPGESTTKCPKDLVDLVIPVEIDLDDDPQQEDRVRLRNEEGSYDAVVAAGDEAATQDEETPIIHYRFTDVPPGTYEVLVSGRSGWQCVLAGLKVTKTDATHNGKSYTSNEDGKEFGHPEESPEEEAENDEHDFGCTH